MRNTGIPPFKQTSVILAETICIYIVKRIFPDEFVMWFTVTVHGPGMRTSSVFCKNMIQVYHIFAGHERSMVRKMTKSNENYTVVREYQCLYDTEELLRRIIRHHMKDACEKSEQWGHKEGEAGSHGEYDG